MEHQTSDFFDSYSAKFSAIYGQHNNPMQKLINHWFRKTMVERFDKTLKACQPIKGKSVLDVGCGPGHYDIALARMGAASVHGIDFAPAMIELAEKQAKHYQVDNICSFEVADFTTMDASRHYNFVIFMGFMDYISDPLALMQKAASLADDKMVFSFPSAGGFLAWQRKLRYRKRCPLYLYSLAQIQSLCSRVPGWDADIERLSRDYFVTLTKRSG